MKGFINLNKPKGMSSARAVAIVKKQLGLTKEKVGHAGTLDPMASGVLPIAIGRATRLFDFMQTKQKSYIAEFTFGYETNTLDIEGDIISKSDIIPLKEQILSVLPQFLGEIEQLPPQFSAKSVNGVRAYDLARSGQVADLKPCKVHIFEFELLEDKKPSYTFKITCGSGTYIRSLCKDLAQSLGAFATMTSLQRVNSGVFNIENSVDIDNISQKEILPCEIVLGNLKKLILSLEQESILFMGKKLQLDVASGIYKAYCDEELIGLASVDAEKTIKMKTWLK